MSRIQLFIKRYKGSGNLNGGYYSENLGVDGRIILEWIFGKYGEKLWIGCIWLGIGTSGGPSTKRHKQNFR
jgi:hypothetical protein